jgi:hypothetical protein
MTQLELYPINPRELDVDGMVDTKGVRFIGKATQQFDGKWRCLADVGGALCIVEVNIKFESLK